MVCGGVHREETPTDGRGRRGKVSPEQGRRARPRSQPTRERTSRLKLSIARLCREALASVSLNAKRPAPGKGGPFLSYQPLEAAEECVKPIAAADAPKLLPDRRTGQAPWRWIFNVCKQEIEMTKYSEALAEALKRLDRNVELGTPIEDAAHNAFLAVLIAGATDRDKLAHAIADHVEANHRVLLWIASDGSAFRDMESV